LTNELSFLEGVEDDRVDLNVAGVLRIVASEVKEEKKARRLIKFAGCCVKGRGQCRSR